MKLTTTQKRIIVDAWDSIDTENDYDLSTERLFAMVCDRAETAIGRRLNDGDISDALVWAQNQKGGAK